MYTGSPQFYRRFCEVSRLFQRLIIILVVIIKLCLYWLIRQFLLTYISSIIDSLSWLWKIQFLDDTERVSLKAHMSKICPWLQWLRHHRLCLIIRWIWWAPKNWCFRTIVLEKTLEGPLDCKEIQPVHPKGD